MKSTIIARVATAMMIVSICMTVLVFVNNRVSAQKNATMTKSAGANGVVGLPAYDINVFARGTTAYSNPDSVDIAGAYVYVGYQNVTAKDGTDNKTSTIVQYTKAGQVVRTFSIPGHCDGLRYNRATNLLWATSNEDANPRIVTIDPVKGTITSYTFPKTPHGGGYDDIIFINGTAFIVASNPTLNAAGVNVFPAVDKIVLQNGQAVLTPILKGNDKATDVVAGTQVTLNLIDPDSLSIDNKGNLVLIDQGGSDVITLTHPGTAQQQVLRLPVGTQLDDTVWTPNGEGKLLVVDGKANTIYAVTLDKTDFTNGTIYTEAPSDSGVAGFVGKVDPKTGIVTPVIVGFTSPTGMAFMLSANR